MVAEIQNNHADGGQQTLEPRKTMTEEQMMKHLLEANEVSVDVMKNFGRHPFGAVLVGPDCETVLMRQGNVDVVNHAESTLCRTAYTKYSPEYLKECTLVTTVEPCAMCAGTMYWANIGRCVYAISEQTLLKMTGDDNSSENPTMNLPCRAIFESGQKPFIEVFGPIDCKGDGDNNNRRRGVVEKILEPHREMWSKEN